MRALLISRRRPVCVPAQTQPASAYRSPRDGLSSSLVDEALRSRVASALPARRIGHWESIWYAESCPPASFPRPSSAASYSYSVFDILVYLGRLPCVKSPFIIGVFTDYLVEFKRE